LKGHRQISTSLNVREHVLEWLSVAQWHEFLPLVPSGQSLTSRTQLTQWSQISSTRQQLIPTNGNGKHFIYHEQSDAIPWSYTVFIEATTGHQEIFLRCRVQALGLVGTFFDPQINGLSVGSIH